MKLIFSLCLLFGSSFAFAQNCPNLSGRWGLYTTNFQIEQKGCKIVTMYGQEPVTNWFMASGKDQPVDNEFHEYMADGGNFWPYIAPPKPIYATYRIRANYVKETLVLEEYMRVNSNQKWDFLKKREFTVKNGSLVYRISGHDWSGKPYVSEHTVPKYSGN